MKKTAILFFLLFLICAFSIAQNKEINNAVLNLNKYELKNLKESNIKIINHWFNYFKNGKKLELISKRNESNKYHSFLEIYLGDYFRIKEKQDSIAFKHYLKGHIKALKSQDTVLINFSLIKLCDLQFDIRNNKLFNQYLNKLKRYKKDTTDYFYYNYYKILDQINFNLDNDLNEIPNFKLAELYSNNNNFLKGKLYNTKGLVYDIFTTDIDYAIINYKKSISNFQKYSSYHTNNEVNGIKMNIAISNFKLKNYTNALLDFKELLTNSLPDDLIKKKDINQWMYRCYDKLNNSSKALFHLKETNRLIEELAFTKHAKSIIWLENQETLKQKQTQLENLIKKTNTLNQKINTILPILTIITILLGLVYILYKKHHKKSKILEEEKSETIKKIDELKEIVIKNHIVLKDKTKVYIADLLYIKSDDHYLKIFLSNGKNHFVRGRLNKIIEELPPNFIRCHRSYVVNRNFIKQINNNNIILTDKTEIPLSRTFKNLL